MLRDNFVQQANQIIYKERIQQYELILDAFLSADKIQSLTKSKMHNDLREFANGFHHFLNGAPADNFVINLKTGEVSSKK